MRRRIAFDLDDTLIPCEFAFPLESAPRLGRLFAVEPLRHGTVALMRELRRHGWKLWVYTTSLRSPWAVRMQFFLHGIWLEGVVNDDRHRRHLAGGRPSARDCSKYPPAFGIDLIVDNSEGVGEEGRRLGFRVVVVRPDDALWIERVRRAVGL